MPVDVTDPTTGQVIKQGTVWDCVFAWIMLGSWDSGRQTQGVHAAVSQMANRTDTRQQQLLHLVANGAPSPSLEPAPSQNVPSLDRKPEPE